MRKKDKMKSFRLARTAVPLIAFSVAACGTASSTQPPKAADSTRAAVAAASATPAAAAAAQFAAAADRICAVQNQRETALGPGLINADIVPAVRLPKAAAYLEKIIAIKSYGLLRCVSLPPPVLPRTYPRVRRTSATSSR
jgi:hypothetical protein